MTQSQSYFDGLSLLCPKSRYDGNSLVLYYCAYTTTFTLCVNISDLLTLLSGTVMSQMPLYFLIPKRNSLLTMNGFKST